MPAIKSKLPSLGPEMVGMAFAMAGSKVWGREGGGGRGEELKAIQARAPRWFVLFSPHQPARFFSPPGLDSFVRLFCPLHLASLAPPLVKKKQRNRIHLLYLNAFPFQRRALRSEANEPNEFERAGVTLL